jgi:hypothetical protein
MQNVLPFTRAKRLYSMNSWKVTAKRWLEAHPLCVYCKERGRITPATEVHHEPDHGGDWGKFWDRIDMGSIMQIMSFAQDHGAHDREADR